MKRRHHIDIFIVQEPDGEVRVIDASAYLWWVVESTKAVEVEVDGKMVRILQKIETIVDVEVPA